MKYHKVTAHSFWWLKWCYILYMLLTVIFLTVYVATRKTDAAIALTVMLLTLVLFFTIVRHTNFYKAGKLTRLIQKHIDENQLCETAFKGNKKIYTFYPQTDWCVDTSANTLHIRFRLSGNQINLRELETGLADRLEKICLNIYEQRGYIEYLFELEQEKALIISSKSEVPGNFGETTIYLSPSLIWNYRKIPHFLIVGSTGSGKTTFTRFIISSMLKCGVRILYLDVKRDVEMEQFCHGNIAITYAYEPKQIADEISLIAEELQSRTVDITNMEQLGISGDTDFNFNPVCVICDEIILMKLVFPDKLYKETLGKINAIIVSGRSKNIYAGLISQSGLAEYFGNSGIRGNIGLKVALGQMSSSEYSMIFGNEYADVKNLRYGEIGSGLVMRTGLDSRPREFVAPYIKNHALD